MGEDAPSPLTLTTHHSTSLDRWAETHDVAKLRRTLPKRNFPYHWQVTLHQSFKVNWLLGAARGAPEPWVLADTDTIFQQCDAAEVRRRFERLGAPLVVGAEKKWCVT